MHEGVRIRWCRFLRRLLGVPGEGGLAGLRGEGLLDEGMVELDGACWLHGWRFWNAIRLWRFGLSGRFAVPGSRGSFGWTIHVGLVPVLAVFLHNNYACTERAFV